MIYIKAETINEGILRAAIRFACANNGTAPDECYEVIGRKILNGEATPICGSWHDAFAAYYYGASEFYGPTSGYQERDAHIAKLEARPDAAEILRTLFGRLHEDVHVPAGFDLHKRVYWDTVKQYFEEAIAGIVATSQRPVEGSGKDRGQVAYEAFKALPATPKDALEWHQIMQVERDEWAAIETAVLKAYPTREVERANTPMNFEFYFGDLRIPGNITRAELRGMIEDSVKSQIEAHAERLERIAAPNITDPSKPTKPLIDDVPQGSNVLRGAFFWEGSADYAKPGLAFSSGRTMTFDYVSNWMRMNRGDIVEIRVERHKP